MLSKHFYSLILSCVFELRRFCTERLDQKINAGNLAAMAHVSPAFLLPFPVGGRFGSICLVL